MIRSQIPAIEGIKDDRVSTILTPIKAAIEEITGRTPHRPQIKTIGANAGVGGIINKINEIINRLQGADTGSQSQPIPAGLSLLSALPKVWCACGIAGDIQASYGVASIIDNGTGVVTINFTTPFSSANYVALVTNYTNNGSFAVVSAVGGNNRTPTSCRLSSIDSVTQLANDPSVGYNFIAFGDQ